MSCSIIDHKDKINKIYLNKNFCYQPKTTREQANPSKFYSKHNK